MPPAERYLSASDAAALLGVNDKTLARWARAGNVPYQRTLGGHRRYPEAEIRRLANMLTVAKADR